MSEDTILSHINLIGTSIISIQPEEIKSLITEIFPGLSSVDVSVGLPASVSIQVTERQPLILWQHENFASWIDAEGVLFTPLGEADVLLTVIANGDPPAAPGTASQESVEEIESEEVEDSLTSLDQDPPALTKTSTEFIQGVLALKDYIPEGCYLQYDPEFGLGWQDPHGWLVYFGKNIKDMDLKLIEYQTILENLNKQSLTPSLISLEFTNAPFYRLEQ
jgi:cell division protein FtsQ